jgi:hypothetical protein
VPCDVSSQMNRKKRAPRRVNTAFELNGADMKLLRNHYRLASHYSMLFLVALAAILAGNPPADADSASSTVGVTARVVRSCRISTTLPPPGNADSIAASTHVDATAVASIAVVCAPAAAPAITISTGSRTAGIAVAQAMSMIDSDVKIKTHKEPATMQIWQGVNSEALALGSIGSGRTGSISVYRHAAAAQNAAAQSDPGRAVVEINF